MPHPDPNYKPASKLLARRLSLISQQEGSDNSNSGKSSSSPHNQQVLLERGNKLKGSQGSYTSSSSRLKSQQHEFKFKVEGSSSSSNNNNNNNKRAKTANKPKSCDNSLASSSSPEPRQIQYSGEDSHQATNTASLLTVDTFLPVSEIHLNSQTNNMSSDEDSYKPKKPSRRSSLDSGKDKERKSRRRHKEEREKKKKKSTALEGSDESNEKANNKNDGTNGEVENMRSRKMRGARNISFSGSTVKRAEEKDARSPSFGESSESLTSALKKGKYGAATKSKISFEEVTDAAAKSKPAPQVNDDAATDRRKAMFSRAAGGSKANLMATNGNASKQPSGSVSFDDYVPRRTMSEPDDPRPGDEKFPQEPVQRRASAPTLVKRKSFSDVNDSSVNSTTRRARNTILRAGSIKDGDMRRSAMSAENQLYVQPKNRHHSVFQAIAHVMAGRVTELVLWTYTASWNKVMLFFLSFYVFNIFTWAFVIMGADTLSATGSSCLYGENADTSALARYEMAFELSWCTFTTVGYGAISPPGDDWGCYPLRMVCALIAFIGVLFGSTTAAIMYSKLMRLLAQAQVTFSSTLCVQYGKGNEGSTVRFGQLNFRASVAVVKLNAMDLLNDSEDDGETGGSDEGYPVIEFRMVNDRANNESSEIWDAQISGVVQLLKEQPNANAAAPGSSTRNLNKGDKAEGGQSTLDLEKVVYYPVSLTPDSHPHFSRIWYARHVLNSESPLLKREFRDMIAQDGKWDNDFNTWQEIRECLNPFISLRITLSGTSAVSAASVYAEHVYEFDDVCVGWRFANMVYEDSPLHGWWRQITGKAADENEKEKRPDLLTKVDVNLLHDIVPQPGDDYEPLADEDYIVNGSMRKFKFW